MKSTLDGLHSVNPSTIFACLATDSARNHLDAPSLMGTFLHFPSLFLLENPHWYLSPSLDFPQTPLTQGRGEYEIHLLPSPLFSGSSAPVFLQQQGDIFFV